MTHRRSLEETHQRRETFFFFFYEKENVEKKFWCVSNWNLFNLYSCFNNFVMWWWGLCSAAVPSLYLHIYIYIRYMQYDVMAFLWACNEHKMLEWKRGGGRSAIRKLKSKDTYIYMCISSAASGIIKEIKATKKEIIFKFSSLRYVLLLICFSLPLCCFWYNSEHFGWVVILRCGES